MADQQSGAKRSYDVNTCTLAGRVGRAELRNTTNSKVLSFSIATSEFVGDKEYTSWVNACVWGNYAETLAPSVQKGVRIIATGKLRSRSYEKDGQKREAVELVCDKVAVEPSGRPAGAAASPNGPPQADANLEFPPPPPY